MKHGVRFWDKKLGRTAKHRRALLRNLLSQLVYYERIQTTVAKAKFMKRAADKLIDLVKSGEESNLKKAESLLFVPHITLSKLRGPLAARYATRHGGYTRILLNGFRGLASDRAPLAVVELVDNPRDLIHALARQHVPATRKQLDDVQKKLYHQEVIHVQDPVTGKDATLVNLVSRHDVSGREKIKLIRQEAGITKMLRKMERSLHSWPLAREAEAAHMKRAQTDRERKQQPILEKLQAQLDEATADGEGRLGRAFRRSLRNHRSYVGEDGVVRRFTTAAEEAFEGSMAPAAPKFEVDTDVSLADAAKLIGEAEDVPGSSKEESSPSEPQVGTLGKLFGKLGLGSKN
ncbi:ribosomal protein L17 [Phlyctochytrium arcticum]|nr:ribosomal protein L17 [Phlyctochytrium arcticum]